jgi:hypothetical protein
MHLLATPDHEAYFDFCSNVIQLTVYDSTYRDEFQRAISWEPGEPPLSHRDADFRALLKHEVTHFLDVSTTAWGRQYSFRKLRFIRLLRERDPAVSDAREVFALESGEIALHSSLVRAGNVPPAECETLQNQLIYTEEYGTCLLLHYVKGSRIEHSVPVSVLSLLEANATASEFLSLLQCANAQDDVVERHEGLEEGLLLRRQDVYEAAKAANPHRWSGHTRNWQPVCVVHLSPDQSSAEKTHREEERPELKKAA